MYDSLFNPTVLTISFAIYSLLLLSVVLAIKVMKLERGNKSNVGLILYLHDRISKLEEENQQ